MFSCCSKASAVKPAVKPAEKPAEKQPLLPSGKASGEEVPVVVNRQVLTTFADREGHQKSLFTFTSQHNVHILAGLEGIIDRAESVAAERAGKRAAAHAELVNARAEKRAAERAELVAARAELVAARAELVKARAAERAEKEEARRRRK
jgi:hypothetical protein